jgi:hypothetical protein
MALSNAPFTTSTTDAATSTRRFKGTAVSALNTFTTDNEVVTQLRTDYAFRHQLCTTWSITTLFCPSSAH